MKILLFFNNLPFYFNQFINFTIKQKDYKEIFHYFMTIFIKNRDKKITARLKISPHLFIIVKEVWKQYKFVLIILKYFS